MRSNKQEACSNKQKHYAQQQTRTIMHTNKQKVLRQQQKALCSNKQRSTIQQQINKHYAATNNGHLGQLIAPYLNI